MATAATERKNGNGTMARHNRMAMAKGQRLNGNLMVETRHKWNKVVRYLCVILFVSVDRGTEAGGAAPVVGAVWFGGTDSTGLL